MTIATLTRFIALVLVALCAPARMVARVRGSSLVQLWLLACGLADMQANGERLRYPGEALAIVAARLDLLIWLAFDPHAARRHLARRARGWRRARLGAAAVPEGAMREGIITDDVVACIEPACADTS